MNFASELLKASMDLADGKSYKTLTRHHEDILQAFYRSLNAEQRRMRFGAAVSDDSIARYCEQIDWRSTLVIAYGAAFRPDAVALNVRIDDRRVENATVATRSGDDAVPMLLRLSALGARDFFAADRMLVNLDGASWLLRHLRQIGSTIVNEDFAEFNLSSMAGEVAEIDSRARSRPTEVRAASCG